MIFRWFRWAQCDHKGPLRGKQGQHQRRWDKRSKGQRVSKRIWGGRARPRHVDVREPGIKPKPQQQPKPLQWQYWVLNPLSHQGTPRERDLRILHCWLADAGRSHSQGCQLPLEAGKGKKQILPQGLQKEYSPGSFCCDSGVTNLIWNTGSSPGLSQWVKDLALLWAVVKVTDLAWILCCCGCGIGWRL